ncbi:glycosyltransferase [Geomonas oryzisoli]|uniref:Glycosyltransferase n=1 Tax=Geomonas oryzisoli TaxID=2847992 RepID=A0ABX8JEJ3_9BACT|nr:glycosyltransferase family 2 protein [Geomonas oryzisoli]QWV95064.1 glycosyltransferase [Geomonas oryzisoli]
MKISVITICYNSARHIEKAMASVLAQSYPDLEYILVDGGSVDGTVDIIREHAARDARIKWVSEPDRGISDAMNKGVALATGEVIAHLHSDEYYLDREVLAEVAATFRRSPGALWATGGFHFVDSQGRFLKEIKVRRYCYRRLIHSNIILHPATFIQRDAFLAAGGFDLGVHYCMDYHLWLRLGAMGDPVPIRRAVACFGVHGGSRSLAQAEAAYAEELKVRLDFLKSRSMWQFPYRLEYQVKKRLNRLFVRRLFAAADAPPKEAP